MSVDERTMTVLLLGETGTGKSAFGSAYLQMLGIFESAPTGEGVTEVTSCRTNKVNGINRCVIDSPGFSDPNGKDAIHIEDMVNFLKKYEKGILVIALVVEINNHRVSKNLQKVIQQLKIMFNNPEIWSHFCIVVTHCEPGIEIDRSEKENFFRPKLASVIESVEGNHFPANVVIPLFFVDSMQFETDILTQQELQRFHDFAASMQKPVSTNNLSIPDEIFAKIEKSTEMKKVSEYAVSVPYQSWESYQEQESYNEIVNYTEQEKYSYDETYSEQVPHERHRSRKSGMWPFRSEHTWTERYYTTELRTRPATGYRTVERSRNEVRYRPVQKSHYVTRYQSKVRQSWVQTETTKKTYYNGKSDTSTKTISSWTTDV